MTDQLLSNDFSKQPVAQNNPALRANAANTRQTEEADLPQALKIFNVAAPEADSESEDSIELSLKRFNRRTVFDYDFEKQELIAKVIDEDSLEEIRQIPDEGLQRIEEGIDRFKEELEKLSNAVENFEESRKIGSSPVKARI